MASCVKLVEVKINDEFTDKGGNPRVRHILKYVGASGDTKQAMILESSPLFTRVQQIGPNLAPGVEVDLGWSKEPNSAGFRDLVQIEKKGTLAADYPAKKWDGKGKGKSDYGQPTAYSLSKDLSMAVSGLMQALIEAGTPIEQLEQRTLAAYAIKKKVESIVSEKTTQTVAATPQVVAAVKPAAAVPKAQSYELPDDSDILKGEDTPW